LFSGIGSIVVLFVLLFSQQIREDHVRAPGTHPTVHGGGGRRGLMEPFHWVFAVLKYFENI